MKVCRLKMDFAHMRYVPNPSTRAGTNSATIHYLHLMSQKSNRILSLLIMWHAQTFTLFLFAFCNEK